MKKAFILATALILTAIVHADEKQYGYTWKHCERHDLGDATLPFDKSDHFRPDCAPDVLYSWQSVQDVESLEAAAKKDPSDVFKIPYMYFWRTPLGSFGYNTALIRVKLKKDVRFTYLHAQDRKCPIDPKEDEHTVYVSYLGNSNNLLGYHEYILCSGGPVASWSTATPEGLKEMDAEEAWVKSHHPGEYDELVHEGGNSDCSNCALFHTDIPDDHTDWTSHRLNRDFKNAAHQLESEPEGEIFYAPGVPHDRHEHFATHIPGYFNPVSE